MTLKVKAFLIFFRRFFLFNLIFTLAAILLYVKIPRYELYSYMFYSKIAGYLFVAYVYFKYFPKEFYFWYNLGLSVRRLFVLSVITDALIFCILFVLLIKLYP